MSSSEPVARWLGTFECRQYADHFHKCGLDTLSEVCKLDRGRLQAMGVNPIDTEKILENVSVLRQTLQGASQAYQFSPMPPSMEPLPLTPTPKAKKSTARSKANADDKKLVPNVTINQALAAQPAQTKGARNRKNNKSQNNGSNNQISGSSGGDNINLLLLLDDDNNTNNNNDASLIGTNHHHHHHSSSLNIHPPNLAQMQAKASPNLGKANLDAARKIGNEIMMNTQQNTQSNSKYTCMPMQSNSPYYANGGHYDYQPQHRPYPPHAMMASQAQHQQQQMYYQPANSSYQHQQAYPNPQHHYQMQQRQQQQLGSPTGPFPQQPHNPNLMRSSSSNTGHQVGGNQAYSQPMNNMAPNNSSPNAMYPNSMSANKSQPHPQHMYFNATGGSSSSSSGSSTNSSNYSTSNNWNNANAEFYASSGRLPAPNGGHTPMMNGSHYQNSVHPLSNPPTSTTGTATTNNNNGYQASATSANAATSSNSSSYYNSNTFDFSPSSSSCSSVSSNSSSSSSSSSSSLNTSNINMNLNSNKSSPLDYLERLVLLPEAQLTDSKSAINNESSSAAAANELNGYSSEAAPHHSNNSFYDQPTEVVHKNANKRSLNDVSPISSKKHCNPINMNYGQDYNNRHQQPAAMFSPPSKQQQQMPAQPLLAEDPAFDDDSALLASLNVNLGGGGETNANQSSDVTSANIMDPSNFDFLDYLPELNSTTIDQTITTATADSASSTSLSNAQPAQLDLNSPESAIDNLFAPDKAQSNNFYQAASNPAVNFNAGQQSGANNYSNPNNMIYSYQ